MTNGTNEMSSAMKVQSFVCCYVWSNGQIDGISVGSRDNRFMRSATKHMVTFFNTFHSIQFRIKGFKNEYEIRDGEILSLRQNGDLVLCPIALRQRIRLKIFNDRNGCASNEHSI